MAGTWSPQVLDANVAPGFSQFAAADIPDLRAEFPNVEHWFADYFLNTVFGPRFVPGHHQLALGIIRRSQHAFFRYHEARELTQSFLTTRTLLQPQVRLYLHAVDKWESFVLQYGMAIDLLVAFDNGKHVFVKNDGSVEERLYTMSNQTKHHASCIASGQAPTSHTVPLWICNDGLASFDYHVTYSEASTALRELAQLAETLKYPEGIGPKPVTSSAPSA
jgi:hypothetical protein